jgi:hypothetical protein
VRLYQIIEILFFIKKAFIYLYATLCNGIIVRGMHLSIPFESEYIGSFRVSQIKELIL